MPIKNSDPLFNAEAIQPVDGDRGISGRRTRKISSTRIMRTYVNFDDDSKSSPEMFTPEKPPKLKAVGWTSDQITCHYKLESSVFRQEEMVEGFKLETTLHLVMILFPSRGSIKNPHTSKLTLKLRGSQGRRYTLASEAVQTEYPYDTETNSLTAECLENHPAESG